MIHITVTGDTYPIRKALKKKDKNGQFHWNHINQTWTRVVWDSLLDQTIKDITPLADRKLTIRIKLQKVGSNGNPLSPIIKFCLQDMERPGVSVLELFEKEVSGSCVSPVQASGPNNPKKDKKEWKKLPGVDKGFF